MPQCARPDHHVEQRIRWCTRRIRYAKDAELERKEALFNGMGRRRAQSVFVDPDR
ncbi:hypothetical protein GCM10010497_58380 [Streptomyces cinereoruber]|uniref:Transposase n=1 Tax=Streptomyces cinereoruber TaxID=67260 RepID=A0AAV4KTU1_9ACTN|nr:hypothetical protein GCM10010497_58380 [Streptomyces cinereoruber]